MVSETAVSRAAFPVARFLRWYFVGVRVYHGGFGFGGVPSESVVLSFKVPRVGAIPGYQISRQCYSLDYYWRSALCGRVDDDVEIAVLFEPGETSEYARGKMRQTRHINGDPLSLQQHRIESEPLRGVPNEWLQRLESGGQ
jgi:hypothetical protein